MNLRDGPVCQVISSQVLPLGSKFHGRVIMSVMIAPAQVVNSEVVKWARWKLVVGVALEASEKTALARAEEHAFRLAGSNGKPQRGRV